MLKQKGKGKRKGRARAEGDKNVGLKELKRFIITFF